VSIFSKSAEKQIGPNLCSANAQASQELTLYLLLTSLEMSQHLIGSLSIWSYRSHQRSSKYWVSTSPVKIYYSWGDTVFVRAGPNSGEHLHYITRLKRLHPLKPSMKISSSVPRGSNRVKWFCSIFIS